MLRKFKFLIFLILILICNAANADNDFNLKLPDEINLKNAAWHAVSEQITNLNDFGVWINRAYKNNLNSWLEINLITGMGGVNTDFDLKNSDLKKAYDSDGEYLILEIKGHKAVFESRAAELHLANALSVNLNDSSVLTIEAAMTKFDLIEIAEYFIDFFN